MSPGSRQETRDRLRQLRHDAPAVEGGGRDWDEIVDEAHAVSLAATALAAEMAVRTNGDARGRDAATLAADSLLEYEADPLQEALLEALSRYGSNRYADLPPREIAELLTNMNDAGLRNVMNAVQGTMLELRVDEMLKTGAIAWPEGAADYDLATRTEQAVDGWFLDSDGAQLMPFQIKASRSTEPIRHHLANNPDVEVVYANTEAAKLAESLGYETVENTGVHLNELLPDAWGPMPEAGEAFRDELVTTVGEQAIDYASQLPVLAFALVGAELAWTRLRGGDVEAARGKAVSRGMSAAGLSAAGYAVSAATGFEYARIAIVVGGKTGGWVISSMDAELANTTAHLNQLREVTAALKTQT